MMEAVMEDPLSPQPQLTRVVHDVKDCIVQLKKENSESGSPITDDSQALHKLCAKLEFLLQSGLKVRTSLLGGKKDYFNYFSDCLSASKATDDGLKFVKNLPEVKTQLGKGRAFIRFGLVHQRLADTLQQCVINQRVTSEWYHPMAVWMQPQIYSELIGLLYDLNDTKFDLSPRGYDLDTAWPTFARKNFNSQNSWTPHSRTSSVSSLSSSADVPPGGNDPYSSRNVTDAEHLRHDLARSESLRTKLEEENEALQNKAVLLEGQLLSLQDQCKQLEMGNEKTKKELSMTEQAWLEQEAEYQAQIRTLKNDVSESSTSGLEEKLKQQANNQQVAALRMEIAGLQKDLTSKDTVSQAKDKLIEALEAKLSQTKLSNADLISKLKTMIKEKNENSERWIKSAEELEALTTRVVTSERENSQLRRDITASKRAEKQAAAADADASKANEESAMVLEEAMKANEQLKKVNSELREMLAVLEDKSKKISDLAKEKVLGFKEENQKLKAELSALQSRSETADEQSLPNGVNSVAMSTSAREEELCESLRASEALNQEIKREIECLRHELEMRESTFDMEKGEITEHMESLQKQMTQQKAELDGATSMITRLEAEKTILLEDISKREDEKSEAEQSWREKLESNQLEMNALKVELTSLKSLHQQSIESQKSEEESSKEIVDNLQTKIQELQKELEVQNNVHTIAQSELEQVKVQLNQSETVNSDLLSKLDISESKLIEVKQLQNEILLGKGDMESSIDKSMQKVKELSEKNLELETSERTLKTKVDELTSTVSKLESDNSNLKEELLVLEGETTRMLDEKLSRLQEKLTSEREARSSLESDLTKIKSAHQDNETRLKTMEEEKKRSMKKAHKQQVKGLQGQFDKLTNQKEELEKQVKSLQTHVDSVNKEKEQLETEAQSRVSHFENELKIQKYELQLTIVKMDAAQRQMEDFESQMSTKDTEIKDLKKQLADQDDLKSKISEVMQENDSLHDVYQSTQLELSSAIAELEEEKAQASQTAIESGRLSQENERLQDQLRTLTSDLSRSSSEIESINLEKDYLASRYKELHAKLVESEAEMIASEELETKRHEFQASLDALKEENHMLKEEVNNLNMDLNNKICDSVAMETELRSCKEDWEEQRQVYEQELSAMKFQLSSEQMKNDESQETSLSSMTAALSEQEALVESLETQLQQIQAEHKQDISKQQQQLAEVKQMLSIREEDNGLLHDNLKRTSLLLDEERNTVLKFKNELSKTQEVIQQRDRELDDMRNDSAALRSQLVKLIKDKDSLWQKNDQLEHVQRLTAASKWMDNNEAKHCLKCEAEFSILLRRHHCRMCGRIFCNSCCGNKIMTAHSSKKERVCDDCFMVSSSTQEPSLSSNSSSVDEPEPSHTVDVPSTNTAPGSPHIASSAEEVTVINKVEREKSDTMSGSKESLDAACDEQTDTDEQFDVITQEEVKIVNTPVTEEVPSTQQPVDMNNPLSIDDIERGLSASYTDLWIKAGESHEVPVDINIPGIVLCWEFSTEPKGISFSVSYYADKSCTEADVLIPLCKCNSHKQAVQGELIARKPGLYTMLFDNTTSRFTSKHLDCKLRVRRPEAAD